MTSSGLRAVVTAAVFAVALCGCGPTVSPTIKIGVAQPLSGPSAARGQDLLNGVKLAAAELNAAGFKIAGKPVRIEVVALDDKGDKDVAKQVAQQFVDQKVTAVIGHLSSDVTEVAIPIYKAGSVPQLFTSSAAELTKLAQGNTFRLVANDALQAKAIANLTQTLNASKVAILYEETAFGAPMSKDVTAALKRQDRKVELSEGVDNKRTDFAAFIAKLKAAHADVLVAAVRDHQLIPLFQQMKAAGLSDLPVVATSVAKTEKMVRAPADVNALFLTSSALLPTEFPAGSEFLNRFRAAYKADPVWAAHYAYDGVYVLANTLKSADSTDPSVLRAKLKTADVVAPVTSYMRFDADGEQRYGTITVYRKRDSRWEALMRSDKW